MPIRHIAVYLFTFSFFLAFIFCHSLHRNGIAYARCVNDFPLLLTLSYSITLISIQNLQTITTKHKYDRLKVNKTMQNAHLASGQSVLSF